MFERFNEGARQVTVLAQDEARDLGHEYLGTEHLLLGLLREGTGLAARVLERLDVTVEEVRAQVERTVGRGEGAAAGQIPFTPRAKEVLELALREAVTLNHSYIGTEHVLLGLAREGQGVAMRILLDLDVEVEQIRSELSRLLGGIPIPPIEPVLSRSPAGAGWMEYVPAVRPAWSPLLLGWLLFGVALGVGILVGWAIWGLA